MRTDYPYGAVLEFEDLAGLEAYLDHPLHNELGAAIFETASDILVYDFAMSEGVTGVVLG